MAKILVVDDEELVLEFVKTALGRIHEVIACDNWLQAIRHIFKERFDLILLDVKLPDITGDNFSSILKQCYSKRLNVVLFSGLDEHELCIKAKETGAIGYIMKSSPPLVLQTRVDRFLREIGIHSNSLHGGRKGTFLPPVTIPKIGEQMVPAC